MKLRKLKKSLFTTLSMMMAVSAIGATNANADTINVAKLAGKDRTQTSIKAAEYVNSKIVVLANGYNFADSLSAYNLSSRFNAKLWLVSENSNISGELAKINPSKVFIVGGEDVLGTKMVNEVKKVTSNIQRVSGADRYATNSETLRIAGYKNVGVADGRNYPDALSASGLLRKHNLGLMLVNGAKVYATDKNVKYTFGGSDSVYQNGGKRLEGKDRYATNEAINKEFGNATNVAITTGSNFADALSTINIVNAKPNTSVMLVGRDMSASQKNYMKGIYNRFIIGGMLTTPVERLIYAKDNTTVTPKPDPKPNPNPVNPSKPDPKPVDPPKPKPNENKFTYLIKSVDGDTTLKTVTVDKIDYSAVEASIPSGYSILTTRDEVGAFRANRIETLYVKPSSMKYFKTQQDYDRYIFDGLKSEGLDTGKVLVDSTVNSNDAFKVLARSLGFSLEQEDENVENNKFKTIDISMGVTECFFTKEVYNKDKYKSNIAKIDAMINASGANKMKTEREKAIRFSKYLRINYFYNSDINNFSVENQLKSRSPYSISDYGTAVCEGYAYTFNQAMLRMGIVSHEVHDSKHMQVLANLDNKWTYLEVTGYAKENVKIKLTYDNIPIIMQKTISNNEIVGSRHIITPTEKINYLYK